MPFSLAHLQIDSEMDDKISPHQRNNNFEIHLKKPLHLNNGAKIAVTEISFPNNILTIPKFVSKRKSLVYSIHYGCKIKAEPNADGGKLITAMNQQLDHTCKTIMEFTYEVREDGSGCFGIKYIGLDDESDWFLPGKIKVSFPEKLLPVFGVNSKDVILGRNEHYKSTSAMKTDDLVEPNIITVIIMSFHGYFSIKEGICTTPTELVDHINGNMHESIKQLISFHYEDGIIKIKRGERYYGFKLYFKFSNEMKKILGFDLNLDTHEMRYGILDGDYPPDVYGLYPGVMVCYASFIKHSIIASEFYPIFRLIPVRRDEGEGKYVSISFNNLEFIKCNTSRLDILRFQLKRLDGEFIDFADNKKIIMTLVIQNPK